MPVLCKVSNMKTRGQAALEFLSTYGFAFLIILVMIGALAYFGVLNPQRFLPERCVFGNEVSCRDFMLQRTGTGADVSFFLGNNIGNTMTFYTANITSDYGAGECDLQNISVSGGNTQNWTCPITGTLPAVGEKVRVGIDLVWMELGGRFNHTLRGEIYATLQ